MSAADAPVRFTGRMAVLVSKYTGFDLSNPANTPAHAFSFVRPESIEETGKLSRFWAKDGYRHVGWAEVHIEIMPVKGMLKSAVKALQDEKETVLADAQRRATQLEGEIQKLLAISYDAEVVA